MSKRLIYFCVGLVCCLGIVIFFSFPKLNFYYLRFKGYESTAYRYLKSLRQVTHGCSYEYTLKCLEVELKNSGLKYEHLGTSIKEIEELRARCAKTEALTCLANLNRECSGYYRKQNIGLLHRLIINENLTVYDLGITEETLNQLLVEGWEIAAKERFQRLRRGVVDPKLEIKLFREELTNANLTLEKFGATEDELNQIMEKGELTFEDIKTRIILYLDDSRTEDPYDLVGEYFLQVPAEKKISELEELLNLIEKAIRIKPNTSEDRYRKCILHNRLKEGINRFDVYGLDRHRYDDALNKLVPHIRSK